MLPDKPIIARQFEALVRILPAHHIVGGARAGSERIVREAFDAGVKVSVCSGAADAPCLIRPFAGVCGLVETLKGLAAADVVPFVPRFTESTVALPGVRIETGVLWTEEFVALIVASTVYIR